MCIRLIIIAGELTPEVVVSAVHHVGSMDELVARACGDQLHLRITQNQLPPEDGKTYRSKRTRDGTDCQRREESDSD